MSDKSRISSLIAAREIALYGEQRSRTLVFEDFLVNIISDICNNMMYDFRDVYLVIHFDVNFDNDEDQSVQCKYCTTKELESLKEQENDSYTEIQTGKYKVSKETMEYFDSRVISVEEIAKEFIAKKLGAYKFKFLADQITNSYRISMAFILGAQKGKPTAV